MNRTKELRAKPNTASFCFEFQGRRRTSVDELAVALVMTERRGQLRIKRMKYSVRRAEKMTSATVAVCVRYTLNSEGVSELTHLEHDTSKHDIRALKRSSAMI